MTEPVGSDFFDCLRQSTDKKNQKALGPFVEDKPIEKTSDSDEPIVCRQFLQRITTQADRIVVQGSHKHTLANPHGIIFQIGCFQTAKGCGYTGPLTAEWSWFKGFSWKIAICGFCLIQLGWLFVSSGSASFSGLILNRLASGDGKELLQ
jgi:hypothetical protein